MSDPTFSPLDKKMAMAVLKSSVGRNPDKKEDRKQWTYCVIYGSMKTTIRIKEANSSSPWRDGEWDELLEINWLNGAPKG